MTYWVTFDRYGTLIDWERGVTDALLPLLPRGSDRTAIGARYIEIEAEVEKGEHIPYREVLDRAGRKLLEEKGAPLTRRPCCPPRCPRGVRPPRSPRRFRSCAGAATSWRCRGEPVPQHPAHHDVGYRNVWIARRIEALRGAEPTRILPDLAKLPDTIEELATA